MRPCPHQTRAQMPPGSMTEKGDCAQIHSSEVARRSAGFLYDAGQAGTQSEVLPKGAFAEMSWFLSQIGMGVFLQTLPSS